MVQLVLVELSPQNKSGYHPGRHRTRSHQEVRFMAFVKKGYDAQ
jgi:hypothetical protein